MLFSTFGIMPLPRKYRWTSFLRFGHASLQTTLIYVQAEKQRDASRGNIVR